jgi:lipopolysaccharide export system permease protein
MPLIERYILRRVLNAFLLTLGALIGTLWVSEVLRELDVVTAKGQAIWIFLLITALALPVLVQVIAPIAFLIGLVFTLNGLTSDSELPVISGAGASREAVNRPVLTLAIVLALLVAFSHHVLAPGSLSLLHGLVTRVRADVIGTLLQDGAFRTVDEGLTMHIREKAPDGSFRDIFVDDERDPQESLQYTAAEGTLLQRAGGSFLVLRHGDLIREDRAKGQSSVVAFETYALDLSQLGTAGADAMYKAKERSTFYLASPDTKDPFLQKFPERVAAEIHDRITAPFYTFLFAFIALAFLGRPRSNRQDRSLAIASVVLSCVLLRGAGFAALAAASGASSAIPLMYVIPFGGIAFGLYAMLRQDLPRPPQVVEAAWDQIGELGRRALPRWLQPAIAAEADRS